MHSSMRKLRVGVWVENSISEEDGGGHGYTTQLIMHLNKYPFESADILFVSFDNFEKDSPLYDKSYTLEWKQFVPPEIKSWQRRLNKLTGFFDYRLFKTDYSKEIQENITDLKNEVSRIIDLIYYPFPGYIIPNVPFIFTLWDIGHLSSYAFPEVSMNGIFEYRKKLHELTLKQALSIFCESESGKKDAIKYLNLNPERLKVVPLFPSEVINKEIIAERPKTLNSDTTFIHYPGQYWSHKNHFNLLVAFKEVIKIFPELRLILTGSDKGNKEYIISIIKELDLTDSVIDLGFISTNNLKWIYQNSLGLVMPTLLGPTNMPLLEAAELGCPVACSDLEGHREQLEDYAIYFDPLDHGEIAQSIIKMVNEKRNGKKREYIPKFNIQNALNTIDHSLTEIRNLRFCWGTNDNIR